VFDQITNVACLPGIQKHALCMPDGHWGYGFPIGGVAAFDTKEGIISPGGIGFDINCGMRLITTNLSFKEVKPKLKDLVDHLFKTVPAGVGCKGFLDVNNQQFDDIMNTGVKWCVENNYAVENDMWKTENYGCIENADSSKVSQRARGRGMNQLGTLGSGNHYLEIQLAKSNNIFDEDLAKRFGIVKDDQVVIMVHCGSRGFGHQVATDYLKKFNEVMPKYGISVNDKELACAPFGSDEGQDYFNAMGCAANMAFVNRQMINHRIREGFSKIFNKPSEDMEMNLVYDVAHNIAKVEKYKIDGKMKDLVVHRKGATRAFGPKQKDLNPEYRPIGQPVILGGSMETGSHLLVGTQKAMDKTFGSTAHGSGRTMSRHKARNECKGLELQQKMEKKGIYVRSVSMKGLAEESGKAYKDINEVVGVLHNYGITKKVVGLIPVGNVKGNVSMNSIVSNLFLISLFVLLMNVVV
jgi:tRNA-splicing ligase RtcB